MEPRHEPLNNLRLFLTTEQSCSYLPKRMARNLVADPEAVNQDIFMLLAKLGFRRSGNHIYRPHCRNCNACLSLRIPVNTFQPNRSQQRVWKKNQDLHVEGVEPNFSPDHYQLFRHYLEIRHRDGGMDNSSPESYLAIISAAWSYTRLYEICLGTHLLAVAVVDELDDGLSSVYTFFDPSESARSLGTFAILWQIKEAERLQMDWVYLGYWIRECQKMAYKANFQPHQVFVGGKWTSSLGLENFHSTRDSSLNT